MAKTTTNKSLRVDNPVKAMRRAPITAGEVNERRDVPGAAGDSRPKRKRPGRAASLQSISQRTRSQRWRSVADGKVKRRPNPASRAGSRRSGTR